MNILNDVSLKDLNTFGIDVKAHCLVCCDTISDLQTVAKQSGDGRKLVLGGGSNVLFMSDFDGIVIHPCVQGIEVISETNTEVVVRAGAGVVWDDLVAYAVAHDYQGIENLSGIPGTVGASPVQNVGAYGMEAGQVICRVAGFMLNNGTSFVLSGNECNFGYRNSIFKNEMKDQAVVAVVDYKLRKGGELNLDYGAVQQKVDELGGVSLFNVRRAIIDIRNSKLPDPKEQGSAGSFFKNPEVYVAVADDIRQHYPQMPSYNLPNGKVKIPAGWLIEQAGWKGRTLGNAGVHSKQALVLVNNGNATGRDVMQLAETIRADVRSMFGIGLEMEVCLI